MGIGFQPEFTFHHIHNTQNFIIQIKRSIALNENQETTSTETPIELHIFQDISHRLERPHLSQLAENLLVDSGIGLEIGLLGGPFEEAERRRLVVLAAEGVEKLLGSEVLREVMGRRERGRIGERGMSDELFMAWK
jgi:hypothetical protein